MQMANSSFVSRYGDTVNMSACLDGALDLPPLHGGGGETPLTQLLEVMARNKQN